MMKNIFKISLIVSFIMLIISCESILDENPPSSISLSSFYQTESDAIAGLYGAYSLVYNVSAGTAINYGELNADNLAISPIVSDAFSWDEFTYNSDVTGGLWSSCFSGINRSNEVILYTERIDINDGTKADIIAEAKALRAFYYFQLVRAMGGVPLYEEPTVGFDNIYAPRASEDEIYNLITRDLSNAVTELEETNSAGRINAHIASALLARVYLYRGDFQNALTYAQKVIDSGVYNLFDDYAAIFKPENDNGIEHIWQLQYLSGETNNTVPGNFGPRGIAGDYKNSFWANTVVGGGVAPSSEFVAESPQSYRKSATVADHYEHIDGITGTITMEQVYGGAFPYYICKYDDREAELQSGENFTIIRYADILLIAAEALNEVDPSDVQKYTWINRIRERARNGVETDLPDLSGLSQEEFRTAVLEERRFELAFEGQRAWDLKRRGLFLETMRAQGKTVEDYMLLFPVPDAQIKLNPNLEQNTGWE
ncbi:RagB/SusD family nutrient uptake outer membrane protein [Maribellus maritimus]|uniref:RagB/SusD family nutrient uptake outer membrane protein n=1 Tax=Maribellus maritimus TaxID=2870838 RepID=UPI001EE9C5FA|nr:RagB/SusD family nutrient uptake outer membrane protein [Maribellus maritimus]MCG6190672.1 RagB/SusD family nutrient uptake outer membrane protein [Maribellus maritimus]